MSLTNVAEWVSVITDVVVVEPFNAVASEIGRCYTSLTARHLSEQALIVATLCLFPLFALVVVGVVILLFDRPGKMTTAAVDDEESSSPVVVSSYNLRKRKSHQK